MTDDPADRPISELAGLSKAQCRRAQWACYFKTFRHWQTWLGFLCMGFAAGLGGALGDWILPRPLGAPLLAGFGAVLGGLLHVRVHGRLMRRYLHQWRQEKGL